MARIRTIKPEFCESESIGKLSREARLLFVLLWTILDDEGRARASSRFLASRLYPYDDDAADLIGGWLEELELGQHIRLYEADGNAYLDVPKWLNHQKIDHPSKSRIPPFREASRECAKTSETFAPHTSDLGPSTDDSVPNGTGDESPPSLTALIFGSGLSWLKQNSGKSEDACRTLLGKWRRELGDEGLLTALGRAQRESTLQPVAWMEAAIKAQRATAAPAKPKWN